jgi:hypothetical protein
MAFGPNLGKDYPSWVREKALGSMEVATMEIAILVLTAIGVAAGIVSALPPLGFDLRIVGRPKMPLEGIPYFRARQAWVAISISLVSLAVSGMAFYYFFRPRVREKIVEKPVDRIVEKQVSVPVPCPKRQKANGGIEVQSGSHVEGVANAPGSMAAGINTGSMELGDVSPKFAKNLIAANTPKNGGFETTFAIQVTSNHIFVMQVTVAGSYISDFHVTPDVTGKVVVAAIMQGKAVGPTGGVGSLQSVSAGKYLVTVQTTRPDNVSVDVSN